MTEIDLDAGRRQESLLLRRHISIWLFGAAWAFSLPVLPVGLWLAFPVFALLPRLVGDLSVARQLRRIVSDENQGRRRRRPRSATHVSPPR